MESLVFLDQKVRVVCWSDWLFAKSVTILLSCFLNNGCICLIHLQAIQIK